MTLRTRIIANILRYSQQRGYSIAAVGRTSGVGQENLSRFINGKTQHLSLDKYEQLAIFFHIDISRLFEPEDIPLPRVDLQQLNMVAERLPDRELRVLVQTGMALMEDKKST